MFPRSPMDIDWRIWGPMLEQIAEKMDRGDYEWAWVAQKDFSIRNLSIYLVSCPRCHAPVGKPCPAVQHIDERRAKLLLKSGAA